MTPSFLATTLDGAPVTERLLSDLSGYFADEQAYATAAKEGDSLLYTVKTVEPGLKSGDLHLGLGTLMPGRIGNEYYFTKGHLHTRRDAAEWYIGIEGSGLMLLEHEMTGEASLLPLTAGEAVYVPGHTAHRTINNGSVPLVYIGIYSADAGHDYGFVKTRNFKNVVIHRDGQTVMLDRESYVRSIKSL